MTIRWPRLVSQNQLDLLHADKLHVTQQNLEMRDMMGKLTLEHNRVLRERDTLKQDLDTARSWRHSDGFWAATRLATMRANVCKVRDLVREMNAGGLAVQHDWLAGELTAALDADHEEQQKARGATPLIEGE